MLDAFGFQLQDGDRIVWCGRQGSIQWLYKGIVLQAQKHSIKVRRTDPHPQVLVTLRRPGFIALVGAVGDVEQVQDNHEVLHDVDK